MNNSKMGYLTSASIILTDRCNMACPYCYEKSNEYVCDDMTNEMGENIVNFLINEAHRGSLNEISLTFFGGEPTLNIPVMRHVFKYAIGRCKEENLLLSADLITNGTSQLTGEYLTFLNEWYASGIPVRIQLSIDGCPEVHDATRIMKNGKGTSSIIEENISAYKSLLGDSFPWCVSIHSTVTLKSLPKLYESYKYFVETLGIINITFMPLHEENWMNSKGDHSLYESQLMEIGDYIIEHHENTELAEGFNITRYCGENLPDKPCGAGYTFCTIDQFGDIYPCHRFRFVDRSTKIGNINDDIKSIDINRSFYIDYTTDAIISKKSCGDCNNAGCFICIAANYEFNQNQLLGFPKHCDMELVHSIVRDYVRGKLKLNHDNGNLNGVEKEIASLAEALREGIIPMKDFMVNINSKVDAVIEMNAVLIQLVKSLLEKE